MLRKWILRLSVILGAFLGIFLIIAFALQVPAVGETIGSPQACGTCHVMNHEVKTLAMSAHRDLTCLECHSATGFFEKPVDEFRSASRHIYYFVSDNTPDIIKPLEDSRRIVQSRCVQCHAAVIGGTHAAEVDTGRYCFTCHRETAHSTPLRN